MTVRAGPTKGRNTRTSTTKAPAKAAVRSDSPWASSEPVEKRRSRRSAEAGALRSFGGNGRVVEASAFEAASDHPLIPRVFDASPNSTWRQNRFMQVLARHLYRNEAWVRNVVRVLVDVHIGLGPKVVSRFSERDEAIMRASKQFDHSGNRSWGGFLRDLYRCVVLDGEAFVQRIDHTDTEFGETLLIPVTFKILTSEFVPGDYTRHVEGVGTFVNGVCRIEGRVTWYAVWTRHPGENTGNEPLQIQYVPASEMYHVRDSLVGGNRGEVVMSSALMRVIKASTLEDAEVKRKLVAICMSVFIERPADDYDNFELPSEEEVSSMIDAAVLSPGGVFEMPYGYKANLVAPPDEGNNFEKSLRWLLLGVCAAVGLPPHEVIGDWNTLPERMARYVGQSMERRADIVHDDIEHQVLERIHDDVVDVMMANGIWVPPGDLNPFELYDHEQEWPQLPMASFKQELAIMLQAKKEGILDGGYIQKNLFGLDEKAVARSRAGEAARNKVLGFVEEVPTWSASVSEVALRILARAQEEEVGELDLQDASMLDSGSFELS